jgi:protease IV
MDQNPPPEGYPQSPVRAEVVYQPPPRRKAHWLMRMLVTLLVLGLLGSLAVNAILAMAVALSGIGGSEDEGRVQEKYYALNQQGTQKIAVLSIEGTILSGEGFFKQQIDHARKDIEEGHLKAIVLRVNSPGGTITGSDYMLHHLRKLADDKHIPIIVSMGGVAASGGYFVSMCVGDTSNTIFAEPTTWTGSIGVIIRTTTSPSSSSAGASRMTPW